MNDVLTAEDIEFYQTNGFVQVDGLLDGAEILSLEQSMERIHGGGWQRLIDPLILVRMARTTAF